MNYKELKNLIEKLADEYSCNQSVSVQEFLEGKDECRDLDGLIENPTPILQYLNNLNYFNEILDEYEQFSYKFKIVMGMIEMMYGNDFR